MNSSEIRFEAAPTFMPPRTAAYLEYPSYDQETGYNPGVADDRLTSSQVGSLLRLSELASLGGGETHPADVDSGLTSIPPLMGGSFPGDPEPFTSRIGVDKDDNGELFFSFWEAPNRLILSRDSQGDPSLDILRGERSVSNFLRGEEGVTLVDALIRRGNEPLVISRTDTSIARHIVVPSRIRSIAYTPQGPVTELGHTYKEIRIPGSKTLKQIIGSMSVFQGLDDALEYRRAMKSLSTIVPETMTYKIGNSSIFDIELLRELNVDEVTDGSPLFEQGYQLHDRDLASMQEINGVPIAVLEERMRPRAMSSAGFIGDEEDLRELLVADDDKVRAFGLTHEQLAEPLEYIARIVKTGLIPDNSNKVITLGGKSYRVSPTHWLGYQESPFGDNSRASADIQVTRLQDGKTMAYSTLLPQLIARYGFYEGKTPYRVAPEKIIDFFTIK